MRLLILEKEESTVEHVVNIDQITHMTALCREPIILTRVFFTSGESIDVSYSIESLTKSIRNFNNSSI